ncbi:hypothetical protein BJV78DRAFT_1210478 [Lactifluus subvellereus]|nr:hypothetical protein BJV78DRAFT_1210478 [Lactifluus subvellereus]
MVEEVFLDPVSVLGILLLAILFNAYCCGVISQQQYSYWTSGFKDPIYVRVFVVVQFTVVLFQSAILWSLAWNVYSSETWQALVNSACQCLLIIMANGFLAVRIYTLTHSRLWSGLVFGFSFAAFITGIVTLVTTWSMDSVSEEYPVSQRAASVVWYALQAVAECLIMYFLSRALLMSRSGIQKSDHVVNHLVRNVIQLGLFATLWAIAGLATWFLLPQSTINTLFEMTSGSIYTHMIYDGLLSRTRLHKRLAERSVFELSSQSFSHTLEGKRSSGLTRSHVAVSRVTVTESYTDVTNLRTTIQNVSSSSGIGNNLECGPASVGKSAAGYEFPYKVGE